MEGAIHRTDPCFQRGNDFLAADDMPGRAFLPASSRGGAWIGRQT
jgi:hypothetical protein